MKQLQARIKNLIFQFNYIHAFTKWDKHPMTLDYEDGIYRQKELVRIIRDSVIHFALTRGEIKRYKEQDDFGEMQRKAWDRISKAKKNQKGDFGELLLFIILCVFFPTQKFVTKVRLRSSTKDQIKGFDCAHFTYENDEVILWLGEAKFHNTYSNAINGALSSIKEHCTVDYLKDEISILASNIEFNEEFPHYEEINDILNGGTSLDKIKIRIPVLITYDTTIFKKHSSNSEPNFIKDMEEEFNKKFAHIDGHNLIIKSNIEVLFIIIPLESVASIKDELESLEATMR
jgi:hypothetical protein